MDWFIAWHRAHSLAFELILFLMACLVSVYSTSIRRFMGEWPRSAAGGIKKNRARYRLDVIKSVHNNAYALMLHLISEGLGIVFGALLWAVVFGAYASVTKKPFYATGFCAMTLGVITSKIQALFFLLRDLYSYDVTVPRLESLLSEAQTKSAKVGQLN